MNTSLATVLVDWDVGSSSPDPSRVRLSRLDLAIPNSRAIQARIDETNKGTLGATATISSIQPLYVSPPPVVFERPHAHHVTFKTLKHWECVVQSMEGEAFVGRLIDEDDYLGDSESDFSLDEVSVDDRSLVVPGAIFDWSIGYRQEESGTRTRVSRLVFRRLPAWSKDRIQKHKLETDEMYRYFNDAAGR